MQKNINATEVQLENFKAAAPEMNQPTRWLFAEDGPPPGKPLDHTVARNLSEASSIVAAGAKDLARTAAHVRSIAREGRRTYTEILGDSRE